MAAQVLVLYYSRKHQGGMAGDKACVACLQLQALPSPSTWTLLADMKALKKIDSVMYRVKDLHVSAKFYADALGLKQVWKDEEHQMIGFTFPESDSEIVIHTLAEVPNPDFSFLVDDVDAFVKEFESEGYTVCKRPFDVRPGKLAVLSDPDGNVINIIDLSRFGNRPRYD